MTGPTWTPAGAARRAWDAVVLGAGPAGALAARELARAGARVLLVDRKPFPRPKVCGACLNGPALAVLDGVGLGGLAGRLGAVPLSAVEFRCGGRSARLGLPGGVAVSRERLDDALADAAVEAGAAFLPATRGTLGPAGMGWRVVRLEGTGVGVGVGSGDEVAARVVLVAAGLGAVPAHDGEFRTEVRAGARVGLGCRVDAPGAAYASGTIFMAVGRRGYVGLVRQEDGRLNVAAAVDARFLRQSGGPALAAAAVLDEAGFPAVSGLAGAEWQGTPALTRRTRPLAAERVFLLGDAAGYVEPFTGEGMAWALGSAAAVAPLALRAARRGWDPSLAREWARAYEARVGRRQRVCRGVAALLRRPWLARAAAGLVAGAPGVTRPLVRRVNEVTVARAPAGAGGLPA